MKRIVSLLLIAMLLIPCLAGAESDRLSSAPQHFMELLYQGEYQAVFDQSTSDVQAALGSADGFAVTMAQLEQSFGKFQGMTGTAVSKQNGMTIGEVACAYEYYDVTFSVVVMPDGLLGGLTVAAAQPKVQPSAADQSQFVTEAITLRTGEADETQGMLTLPNGDGPFPAVIMMQGSGPSDMNETAYGITPFRDIAEGLAQAGVASIRYDKYTYAHASLLQADAALLAAFTVEQEYMIDAQDALTLLQTDSRIGDIYLMGHSLGAMIVPRVMQALGPQHFAGGIIIAGSPLPLWEIQYHQNLALLEQIPEENLEEAQARIDAEVAKLDQLDTLSDAELQNTTFFGISAYYQKDLMSADAAQTAIGLQKPLLIIQGGKDWQVPPADGIDAWKQALGENLQATYIDYPDVNHLLCEMAGDAAGDPSDYQAGDTVSPALIHDLAAWILAE